MYHNLRLYELDSPLLPRDTGIYVRLSDEEKEKNLSDSISNQKMILLDYAEKMKLNVVNVYADEHHTGSTFNRPVFKEMIEDIEKGLINCVLIKDLSRFGREHIDAGYYLEKYFPKKGVRFLSYNKKLDSYLDPSRMSEIDIPFENLLNEQTVKHTSAVTKASLSVKRKEGLFVGSTVPYGYNRDINDKHKLVIDNDTYKTVQYIFNEFINYKSMAYIARELNNQNVLTPASYRNRQKEEPIKTSSIWTPTTIRNILVQEIYTGDMVQGKTYSYNHKIKKRFPLPRSKWDIVKNIHEPIIDAKVFETVHQMLSNNVRKVTRINSNIKPSIFAGLVYCAECGKPLTRNTTHSGNKTYNRFVCSTYKKQGKEACASHLVSEDVVINIVLSTLNTLIDNLCDVESAMKKDALLKHKEKIDNLNLNLLKAKKDLEVAKSKKNGLYSDYKEGIINFEEYEYMSKKFKDNIDALGKEINEIECQIQKLSNGKIQNNEYVELYKSYNGIEKLERKLVIKLIDSITIDKDINIDIKFKFQNPLKQYLSYI